MAQLQKNEEFLVMEEKWLGYIVALVFVALFTAALILQMRYADMHDIWNYYFVILLVPAFFYLSKARSKRVYLRINKKGIYADEKLVTDWDHFLKAFLAQQPPRGRVISALPDVRDNFVLVVEFTRDDPKKGFRRSIPLTNTQNKSEEDVLQAIRIFHELHKQAFHFNFPNR